jgi:hypothetical protein
VARPVAQAASREVSLAAAIGVENRNAQCALDFCNVLAVGHIKARHPSRIRPAPCLVLNG